MPEQHRHLASKHEDAVNLQRAEAYRGGRPPTACFSKISGVFLGFIVQSFFKCNHSLNGP